MIDRKYHIDGSLPTGDEIFVFGSNQSGIHGAGAAKVALTKFGAIFNHGFGRAGRSYAIPTKDFKVDTLPIEIVIQYVNAFIDHTKANPKDTFFVTRVGCGLAGYNDSQIAPLFKKAERCSFANEWRYFLEN